MPDYGTPPEEAIHNRPLLLTESLNLSFRKRDSRIEILSDINIKIDRSEVFGLAGESGCGKSMTALSIMRLLPRMTDLAGKIGFYRKDRQEYTDLLNLRESEMIDIRGREIGMIFQEPMTSLNPVFTVGSQISETLTTHLGLSKRQARERSIELLRLVKIPLPEHRVRDYPHQISGGMRQRIMIAMAVACNPSLLIADEPTTALDVTIQAEIIRLLLDIKKRSDMAILFISHDLALISEMADRVAVMYAGRIVEVAGTEALFSEPAHPYTIGLLESLPSARHERLNPIPGNVPSPGELPEGCKFSPRCSYSINDCNIAEPDLREASKAHLVRCFRAEEIGKWR